jgi:hypothetical protein
MYRLPLERSFDRLVLSMTFGGCCRDYNLIFRATRKRPSSSQSVLHDFLCMAHRRYRRTSRQDDMINKVLHAYVTKAVKYSGRRHKPTKQSSGVSYLRGYNRVNGIQMTQVMRQTLAKWWKEHQKYRYSSSSKSSSELSSSSSESSLLL